jgi:hypothetical protein
MVGGLQYGYLDVTQRNLICDIGLKGATPRRAMGRYRVQNFSPHKNEPSLISPLGASGGV